jgi:hypothetical protein
MSRVRNVDGDVPRAVAPCRPGCGQYAGRPDDEVGEPRPRRVGPAVAHPPAPASVRTRAARARISSLSSSGRSYAGAVVTTAAADRMTGRIAQLVFVDTGPPPDGAANEDFNPPQERERRAALVAEHGDGWRLPRPPWADVAAGAADVDESVVALLAERSTARPWATAIAPVRLTGAWEKLPRLGVLPSFTVEQTREMAATVLLYPRQGSAHPEHPVRGVEFLPGPDHRIHGRVPAHRQLRRRPHVGDRSRRHLHLCQHLEPRRLARLEQLPVHQRGPARRDPDLRLQRPRAAHHSELDLRHEQPVLR